MIDLRAQKEEVGTNLDNEQLRDAILKRIKELKSMENDLRGQLEQFKLINVPYRSQKQHEEKHVAYEKRLIELAHKYRELDQEAKLTM